MSVPLVIIRPLNHSAREEGGRRESVAWKEAVSHAVAIKSERMAAPRWGDDNFCDKASRSPVLHYVEVPDLLMPCVLGACLKIDQVAK